MLIEVAAPACLPLGLVVAETSEGARPCYLGITLQHPPVNLVAQAHAGLDVTGARADLAYAQARRFLQHYRLEPQAKIEIEMAIPAVVGLGSEAVLGLSIGRALAWVHDLPLEDTSALAHAVGLDHRHALEMCCFDRGGLLLVGQDDPGAPGSMPPVIRRAEIAHPENDAWAFVLYWPRASANLRATLEADRLAACISAAPLVDRETGRLVHEALWPALERDDLTTFGSALMDIQRLTQDALAASDTPLSLSEAERRPLDLMRDGGAVAWGQSVTGQTLFGLIRGAQPSRDLRKKLADYVGYFGGTVMASIADNAGARHKIAETWTPNPYLV